MRNLSYENEFCTKFHFHKNGFALRLALKQRHIGTRKWSILVAPKWHVLKLLLKGECAKFKFWSYFNSRRSENNIGLTWQLCSFSKPVKCTAWDQCSTTSPLLLPGTFYIHNIKCPYINALSNWLLLCEKIQVFNNINQFCPWYRKLMLFSAHLFPEPFMQDYTIKRCSIKLKNRKRK